MRRPDILIVDGHAYSWRRLCELRQQQLDGWSAAQLRQSPLFELKEDRRPAHERNAVGRYREPSLLDFHS
jgi:hypothetical protein